ncbi:MAG: phage portal protein [Pirellulales bacterium]
MSRRTTRRRASRVSLSEAFDDLYAALVDPHEAWSDGDGESWLPLSGGLDAAACPAAISTEADLRAIRGECRALAVANEFAINAHENRISYLVGSGHNYRATPKKGLAAPEGLHLAVQSVLDDFCRVNAWRSRQEEIVRRRDRDGEAFLRLFLAPDGTTRIRFVEPGQIATPVELAANPAATFGIHTDADDVETVIAYYVDGQPVAGDEIQHRKANVDANVKRGLPMFYPVRKNLRRAEKLLRNMSVLAEVQSAIALVRKHRGPAHGVQQFAAATADATATNATTGRTTNFKRFAPGTILDVPATTEYDFPAASLDAGSFVAILKAELRAIAARLVMPEFMLTSDASNANYASTLVAEGPAVRMFARLQARMIEDDLFVLWRVVGNAVRAGKLPAAATESIEIQAAAPSLAIRDELKEAHAYKIEHEQGILSKQTWSQRRGLDFDQEQENLRADVAVEVKR